MSAADATATRLMTADEFMALPDNGKERWLVDGQVFTIEDSMTARNRIHSELLLIIGGHLRAWLLQQPLPRGKFHGGDAGFRLQNDPDILVGIDIAYASPELIASTPPKQAYYNGSPTLAVEIISPSDKHENIVAKVESYLAAGSVVWMVDPDFQTIMVYQLDQKPKLYSDEDEIVADPYLPGFRVAVANLFED